MATRFNREHDERTRQKIKTSQIINRLQNHIDSEKGDLMTQSQVNAAVSLLKKTLPDLKQVELTGEVSTKSVVRVIDMTGEDVSDN